MAKQKGLGKGLGALLGEESLRADTPAEGAVSTLPLQKIEPNPLQPRKTFAEEELDALAESIRIHGIIQPLTVRLLPNGYYQIIAGERRWRAARLAGLSQVPVLVIEADDRKAMELALIENLQRADLNPIEEAEGYQQLISQYGMTQEQAAERLGKSRPALANLLRLLTLPDAVRQMLIEGKLSAGHGRALVTVDRKRQLQLANLTVQQGWSVRQLERICAQPVKEETRPPKPKRDAQISRLEGMARELFGTRVKLDGDQNNGKITLYYYSADDLQRIWDVMVMAGSEE